MFVVFQLALLKKLQLNNLQKNALSTLLVDAKSQTSHQKLIGGNHPEFDVIKQKINHMIKPLEILSTAPKKKKKKKKNEVCSLSGKHRPLPPVTTETLLPVSKNRATEKQKIKAIQKRRITSKILLKITRPCEKLTTFNSLDDVAAPSATKRL